MTFAQFRQLSEAATRRQRREQVSAMVAARAANLEGKAFEKLLKSLTDGN